MQASTHVPVADGRKTGGRLARSLTPGGVPVDYFDEPVAASYETRWPELFEPDAIDPVVNYLADLAGPGPALELGIGTGRIALPLSLRRHGQPRAAAMSSNVRPVPAGSPAGRVRCREPP